MYTHVILNLPEVGLLLESDDEKYVANALRTKILTQLVEMPLEKFMKFCTIEKREVSPLVNQDTGYTDSS